MLLREIIPILKSAVSTPVCIAGPDWSLWGLTDGGQREQVCAILAACAGPEGCAAAAAFGAWAQPCVLGGEVVCYLVVLARDGARIAAYAQTLLQVKRLADQQSRMELNTRKRMLLANQLAGAGAIDTEVESHFRALNYTVDLPRCAVLCVPVRSGERRMGVQDREVEAAMEQWAGESGRLGQEDIYAMLNTGCLLIFRAVQDPDGDREEVENLVGALARHLLAATGGRVEARSCVGSVYRSASELHKSYEEANYLYSNFEACSRQGNSCLFIQSFLLEYFFSELDAPLQHSLLQDLGGVLAHHPILADTALALAHSDNRPAQSAQELDVHRNTITQRLQKLRATLDLDPLHQVRGRAALHLYAVQRAKKTVWNAGIIVQPGSVLYQGLQHLSESLYQNSGGTFQLNLHTVSTSGDNRRLFQMLASGTLDIVVGSTIALNSFTDGAAATLQLPFLFDSEEEAEHILRHIVVPELQERMKNTGVLCLDIWSMGWRYLTSRETPIRIPDDLKGRKIRILASERIKDYFNHLGAIPLQIYYNNIREALAANIIVCQENPYSNILDMEFYHYQDYVTELPLWYSMEALCVSRQSLSQLDEGRRAMLLQTAAESSGWLRVRQREVNARAKEELVANGMHVVVPTEEEVALWRETIQPLYQGELRQEFLEKLVGAKRQYAKKRT